MLLRRARVLAVLLLFAACPKKDDTGTNVQAVKSCEQATTHFCKKQFECDPDGARVEYGSLEACIKEDVASCKLYLAWPGSKETLASWAACDSAMGAQSCDEFNFGDTIEVCKVLPGSRADDEPCLADSQCASTRCAMIARPAENDPHPELYPCGTCQPRLQNGAPCEDTGDECLYGSFCVKSKCTPVIREGGACADSDGCGYNLRCLEGACRKGVPLGGACAAAADCMGWWAACTNGVCSEPSGIAQGQTCNVDGNPDQESCQVNTFCDGETRTCARPRVLGEACTSHDVCGYELSCQNGKCAALTDALCMQP